MTKRPAFLENSVIIGAHPDDELLWFTSILREVDEVIIVFCDFWAHPEIGAARTAAIDAYPRGNVSCLNIAEAGAYGCADWSDPALTDHGIALGFEASRRGVNRLVRKSISRIAPIGAACVAEDSVARSYQANYEAIYRVLKSRLDPSMNVFTHNPWGEYGHEDHIQVFRALQKLRGEIGFKLWMSNYCTNRALPLAMRYFQSAPGGYLRLPADKGFANEVASVYKQHGCWTWADDWAWFDEECFMEAPLADGDAEPHSHLFPLNFFTIDPPRQRRWLPMALTMSVASAALGATIAETI